MILDDFFMIFCRLFIFNVVCFFWVLGFPATEAATEFELGKNDHGHPTRLWLREALSPDLFDDLGILDESSCFAGTFTLVFLIVRGVIFRKSDFLHQISFILRFFVQNLKICSFSDIYCLKTHHFHFIMTPHFKENPSFCP